MRKYAEALLVGWCSVCAGTVYVLGARATDELPGWAGAAVQVSGLMSAVMAGFAVWLAWRARK